MASESEIAEVETIEENPEAFTLLDQYISSQLAEISGTNKNFFDPSLPPTPDEGRMDEQWVLRLLEETPAGSEAGPYSYSQMHAWIGAGHLGPHRLVRLYSDSDGWMTVADSGLCRHRWFVADPDAGDGSEVQGPFTPYQVSSWFAHGELYWHYCNTPSPPEHQHEDDWYFLDDDGHERGPFAYNEMCAWFSAGVMSKRRLLCRDGQTEWRTAESHGFGNSKWFVVADNEDNITGPLTPLQVRQWFSTGWLQEYLVNASSASAQVPDQSESTVNPSTDSEVAEWFYLDDAMVPQGPFTKKDMMNWFQDGSLTYLNRYVARDGEDWQESSQSELYDPTFDVWFVENGETGQPIGPWRADEIMSMWSGGELCGAHRVALGGATQWTPLGAYIEDEEDDEFLNFFNSNDIDAYQTEDMSTDSNLGWYVNDGDYTLGPYGWDDMRRLFLEGRLDPSQHWVSVSGKNWMHPAEAGFVEDENDWGGWFVLTRAVNDFETDGPYLASDIAYYMDEGLIGGDVLLACGDSEWCSPEYFGFSVPDREGGRDWATKKDAFETVEDLDNITKTMEKENGLQYFLRAADDVLGPYPLNDLIMWLHDGLLESDAYVALPEGNETHLRWKPLSKVIQSEVDTQTDSDQLQNYEVNNDVFFMLGEDEIEILGPFEQEHLRTMIEAGKAVSSRLICKRGAEDWVYVSDVFPEYFADDGKNVAKLRTMFETDSRHIPSGKVPTKDARGLELGPMFASKLY